MTSRVAIINRALTKLGAARITSPDDDVQQAREAASVFDTVRDDELRARGWSFSFKRDLIAADVDTPAYGYAYQYTLPTDLLRIWSLDDAYFTGPNLADYVNGPNAPYTVEGNKILTDLFNGTSGTPQPLKIRYIRRVEDTNLWDSCFVEAFACRLAVELAESLTQSTTRRELAWKEYDIAIKKGRRANAIELPPDYIADDSWVLARLR